MTGALTPQRQALPNRRASITQRIVWNSVAYDLAPGFDKSGRFVELFAQTSSAPPYAPKVGTEMWLILQDACVLISHLLQLGYPATEIRARLARQGFRDNNKPGSIIGAAIDAAIAIEAEEGPTIARVNALIATAKAGAE